MIGGAYHPRVRCGGRAREKLVIHTGRVVGGREDGETAVRLHVYNIYMYICYVRDIQSLYILRERESAVCASQIIGIG